MSEKSIDHKRGAERFDSTLSIIVKTKDDQGLFRKETTELITFSRSGAGFYLNHQLQVGQLLSLLIQMPKELRCYDFDKELYRIWGLVQHCHQVQRKGKLCYQVGVAFTGKYPPASYHQKSSQSYRITGINADATWQITEAKKPFVNRRHQRIWFSTEVSLSALDANKNMVSDEKAMTENISPTGAAVISVIKINVGSLLNIEFKSFDFSTIAIVRECENHEAGLSKLHIEFVEKVFPVEEIT